MGLVQQPFTGIADHATLDPVPAHCADNNQVHVQFFCHVANHVCRLALAQVHVCRFDAAVPGDLLGIAQAAGAFDPDSPDVPRFDDPAVADAMRLDRQRRALAAGRGSTITVGGAGVDPNSPLLARPTLSSGGDTNEPQKKILAGPGGPGGI